MTALIDSDVLLDVALRRQPFFPASDQVVRWCEDHPGSGFIAWHTVSNIYYILRRTGGDASARGFIATTLARIDVASTGTPEAKHALHLAISDFEDALQISAALAVGADAIVTRNARDYSGTVVPALSPEEFLRKVAP